MYVSWPNQKLEFPPVPFIKTVTPEVSVNATDTLPEYVFVGSSYGVPHFLTKDFSHVINIYIVNLIPGIKT